MRIFDKETFSRFDDRDSGRCFENAVFRECFFDDCCVSITEVPELRSTFRNMRFENCSQLSCSIGAAIVEDVVVDGLKNQGDMFQTFGAVFKHVELRGNFDSIMITNDLLPFDFFCQEASERRVKNFREANRRFYCTVDWALDISKGEFRELALRGVPARLIRRDPETQIVITRQRAMKGDFRELKFLELVTPYSIQYMLDEGWEDFVFVAPKRRREFRNVLADIKLLRKAGIAEPD